MLTSVETDLVARDPAIPGLATVLDPDAFLAALRQATPGADLRAGQITYLRYKPGKFCRAAYHLSVAGMETALAGRACRPADVDSWLEGGHSVLPGPLGAGRAVLEDCAVVWTAFPNDLALPELARLTNAAERGRVLRELLPERPDLWQAELRCLRSRPERRYVAELLSAERTRAIVKCYTRKAYLRARHNACAFQPGDRLRVARLLGGSDRGRLLAFEWLHGRVLTDLWGAPGMNREVVVATGAALAALHDQHPDGLPEWTCEAAVADLFTVSSEIGFIIPDLAGRADELARRLQGLLEGQVGSHVPVHGDFSANQGLVDGASAAIIDLDWAGYSDAADDLGNFLAQVERFALRGDLDRSRAEWLRDALLEGYSRVGGREMPGRVCLYTAAQLFRRARFPFRTREPDWPRRAEALLDRAAAMLDTLG